MGASKVLLPSRGGRNNRNITGEGFVLTLKFTGQQVAGMRGMFSQKCWLNTFQLPMTIVEPFVTDSRFMHTKALWEADSLKLSDYYKMPSRGGLEMSTWQRFLNVAPRKLIVVNIVYNHGCMHFGPQSCKQPSKKMPTLSCKPLQMITDTVTYLEARGFEVVRKVCFNCSAPEIGEVSPMRVTEYIFGEYAPQDVTLLFSHWKFSFHITPNCASHMCNKFEESFRSIHSSSNLESSAARYTGLIDELQEHAGQPIRSTIAVMVRVEWLLVMNKNSSLERLGACLQTVVRTERELESSANGTTRLVLAVDVGKFGSGTYPSTLRIHNIPPSYLENLLVEVKEFVFQLYDGKLDFDVWEESYVTAAGSSADRGYIASLQSVVASEADCLVLMGGGHFHEMTLQKYYARAPSQECVHKVCYW